MRFESKIFGNVETTMLVASMIVDGRCWLKEIEDRGEVDR